MDRITPAIMPGKSTSVPCEALDVFSARTLNAWYNLYKTHEPEYFYELMNWLLQADINY